MGRAVEHNSSINDVEFSPDGRWIVTASEDKRARIWEAASGLPRERLFEHDREHHGGDVLPSGRKLLTASTDGYVRIWELAKQRGRKRTGQALAGAVWPSSSRECASIRRPTRPFPHQTRSTPWNCSPRGRARMPGNAHRSAPMRLGHERSHPGRARQERGRAMATELESSFAFGPGPGAESRDLSNSRRRGASIPFSLYSSRYPPG